eukprot:GEMP01060364.1.p1 GENE.GEMP01060364.1~~GEMP01060364.1.p1  ORF type:complete len:395 (+),score=67.87 GEMP01060364.1:75-1259(+)
MPPSETPSLSNCQAPLTKLTLNLKPFTAPRISFKPLQRLVMMTPRLGLQQEQIPRIQLEPKLESTTGPLPKAEPAYYKWQKNSALPQRAEESLPEWKPDVMREDINTAVAELRKAVEYCMTPERLPLPTGHSYFSDVKPIISLTPYFTPAKIPEFEITNWQLGRNGQESPQVSCVVPNGQQNPHSYGQQISNSPEMVHAPNNHADKRDSQTRPTVAKQNSHRKQSGCQSLNNYGQEIRRSDYHYDNKSGNKSKEDNDAERRISSVKADQMDNMWGKVLQKFDPSWVLVKEHTGVYRLGGPDGRRVSCTISHDGLLTRVGGGWMTAESFLRRFSNKETGLLRDWKDTHSNKYGRNSVHSKSKPFNLDRLLQPTKTWAHRIGVSTAPDIRESRLQQ